MCKLQPKIITKPDLKVLCFNVEGLASELEEPDFISLMNKHDICLFSETWKKDDSKIELPGWWDFSVVRPKYRKFGRHSGGITICCRSNLRPGLKIMESSEGFIWFKLDAKFFNLLNDLYVGAVYIPPQYTKNLYSKKIDYFKCLCDALIKYGNKGNIILAGDFNARTGVDHLDHFDTPHVDEICPKDVVNYINVQRHSCDDKVNNYGKKLSEICKAFNLQIANGTVPGDLLGSYTCYANRGASVVDYVIEDMNIVNIISKLEIIPPHFGPVHSPLTFRLENKIYIQETHENFLPSPPKFKWDPSKAKTFSMLLNNYDNSERLNSMIGNLENDISTTDIDKLILNLTELLFDTTKACMTLVRKRGNHKTKAKPKSKPWYNHECSSLKKRLTNLSKLLLKSPKDPIIRGQYSKMKKEYKKLVKYNKVVYETDNINTLNSLTSDPKKFWSHLKKINNTRPIKLGTYISKQDWVNHFKALNNKDPSSFPQNTEFCKRAEEEVQDIISTRVYNTHCDILDTEITPAEVEAAIKTLKTGKASALDSLSNDILKASSKFIPPVLAALFSKLVTTNYFPVIWSTGIIIPIHKSGELDDPNNFRGITLNSCMSKLFTFILNRRLTGVCEDNYIINDNQIGFRKGFRTSDHVFTLKTIVDKTFSKNKKLYTCFVDFKKAYDTVWRTGLFLKLLKNNISPNFVKLVMSMYSNLHACIQLPEGLSESFESLVGLKQGCNMSPLLFNIFINDFVDLLNTNSTDAPYLDNLQVSCLLYADDLVLLSESQDGLQEAINTLHNFTSKWFLEVNLIKTKCLVFSKRKVRDYPSLYLGNKELDNCDEYCYLGVIFSNSGSMRQAFKLLHDKALGAMFSIIRNVNRHYACRVDILLELFEKMVLPIALYNCEVWGTSFLPINVKNNAFFDSNCYSKHIMEKLQTKFMKMILGVNQNTSNLMTLSEVGQYPIILKVFKHMIKFLVHLSHSSSKLLGAALKTNIELTTDNFNSWFRYLERILKFCNLDYLLYTNDGYEISLQINKLDKTLRDLFIGQWEHELAVLRNNNTSKYGLFLDINNGFKLSDYLTKLKIPKYRIALSKIRLSSHILPIETGRYEQVPRNARYCPFGCSSIGDEQHYLFTCDHPFIKDIREPYISKLRDKGFMVGDMPLVDLLISPSPVALGLVGGLCSKILNIFKDITI